jgi:DNA polymerase (family 10)
VKTEEIVKTGSLKQLQRIEQKVPTGLSELMKIPELGSKRVGSLYRKLQISTVEELKNAAREGKLRNIRGFGKKMEEKDTRRYPQRGEKEWEEKNKIQCS